MPSYCMYVFWEQEYINKWLVKDIKKINEIYKKGDELILKLLKTNKNLKEIKYIFVKFLDYVRNRKINKLPIYRTDHILAAQSLFGLIKLKVYDVDEVIIVLKNKKALLKSTAH